MMNIKTGVNSILIGEFLPPQGTNNFSIAITVSFLLVKSLAYSSISQKTGRTL
jgi:hypothetical protein